MSVEEIFRYLEDNPTIRDSASVGMRVNKSIRYPASIAAGLHFLEYKRKPDLAETFWDQMITGAGLVENTGPYTLRKLIVEDRMRARSEQMDRNMLVAISIKAWNYWEYDYPLRQARWHRGADEPYPRLGQKPRV